MSEAVLARLQRRILSMVGRGRVTTVDDTKSVQRHQVDFGPTTGGGSLDIHDNIPVAHFFGFSSNPPPGADVIVLFVGGDRNKPVVIGHNHQKFRHGNLSSGDSVQFDSRGAYAWLTPTGLVVDAAGGNVTIQNAVHVHVTASADITLTAPTVAVQGNLTVSGATTGTGAGVFQGTNVHTHTHGGVTTGGGNTGAPN